MVHASISTVTPLSPLPDDPVALQALVLVRNQRAHCRIGEMAGMRF